MLSNQKIKPAWLSGELGAAYDRMVLASKMASGESQGPEVKANMEGVRHLVSLMYGCLAGGQVAPIVDASAMEVDESAGSDGGRSPVVHSVVPLPFDATHRHKKTKLRKNEYPVELPWRDYSDSSGSLADEFAFVMSWLMAHVNNELVPNDPMFSKPAGLKEVNRSSWPNFVEELEWGTVTTDPTAPEDRLNLVLSNMIGSTRAATMNVTQEYPNGGNR